MKMAQGESEDHTPQEASTQHGTPEQADEKRDLAPLDNAELDVPDRTKSQAIEQARKERDLVVAAFRPQTLARAMEKTGVGTEQIMSRLLELTDNEDDNTALSAIRTTLKHMKDVAEINGMISTTTLVAEEVENTPGDSRDAIIQRLRSVKTQSNSLEETLEHPNYSLTPAQNHKGDEDLRIDAPADEEEGD